VTPRKTPRHRPDYHLETLKDRIVLYHHGQPQVMQLNETASIIWQLCDGQRTTTQIARLLKDAYPEQASEIDEAVTATLKRFEEQGALEFV